MFKKSNKYYEKKIDNEIEKKTISLRYLNFFFHPYYIAELKFETFLVRLLPILTLKKFNLKVKISSVLISF